MKKLLDTDYSKISIHAPRTGSDHKGGDAVRLYQLISIHAPRTGSDVSGIITTL